MPKRRPLHFALFLLFCGGGGALFLRLRVAPPPAPPPLFLGRNSIPESMCDPAYLAMVVVKGADSSTRQLIRETWGHPFHTHMLGLSVAYGVSVDELADLESAMFGDLLHLQLGRDGPLDLLQAAREACRRPYFLVMLKKDVFVNTFALVDFLKDLQKSPLFLQHRNVIWCHLREADHDVSASNDASGQTHHCLPGAFITVPSAVDAILLTEHSNNISQTMTSVTGALAKEAGVDLVQMEDRLNEKRTIFRHVDKDDKITRDLWKKLIEGRLRKDGGL
ncbi:hypothetical protein JTE90_009642 [Oedothorax gibbosus]|uniref:Hexosyltransferase n=1 Tax=Oedothorax gibbosus TaxID=931172 RepID=A0AAV6VC10_9ARAC|nr:hypothetical protein JTE90_009642 [Oedothorax gibbosus]